MTQILLVNGGFGFDAFAYGIADNGDLFLVDEKRIESVPFNHLDSISFGNMRLVAWEINTSVVVKQIAFEGGKILVEDVCTYPLKARAAGLKLSPKGTYLTVISRPQAAGTHNLFIIKLDKDRQSYDVVKSFYQSRPENWELCWTNDENDCVRQFNAELFFFSNNNFEQNVGKITAIGIVSYAFHPISRAVAFFVLGKQGKANTFKVHSFPNFKTAVIAKTDFKSERAHFFFNCDGTCVAALTSTESSQSSYYGEQRLYFARITEGVTCPIELDKNGPIYTVAWSPNDRNLFCILYGYMPCRATLFNSKCEKLASFGLEYWNEAFFNPQGNLLCLAGFGGLNGNVQVFDVSNLEKTEKVSQRQLVDTSILTFAPDGKTFVAATTAPRLRVNNGFKVLGVASKEFHSVNFSDKGFELYNARWLQKGSNEEFPAPKLRAITEREALANSSRSSAYIPPSLRGVVRPHLTDGAPASPSGQNSVGKKKKGKGPQPSAAQGDMIRENGCGTSAPSKGNSGGMGEARGYQLTGDVDMDKKIQRLAKTMSEIQKLKEQQSEGKVLQPGQITKIERENEITEELGKLTVKVS